jgi:hypothetical protein
MRMTGTTTHLHVNHQQCFWSSSLATYTKFMNYTE